MMMKGRECRCLMVDKFEEVRMDELAHLPCVSFSKSIDTHYEHLYVACVSGNNDFNAISTA